MKENNNSNILFSPEIVHRYVGFDQAHIDLNDYEKKLSVYEKMLETSSKSPRKVISQFDSFKELEYAIKNLPKNIINIPNENTLKKVKEILEEWKIHE